MLGYPFVYVIWIVVDIKSNFFVNNYISERKNRLIEDLYTIIVWGKVISESEAIILDDMFRKNMKD